VTPRSTRTDSTSVFALPDNLAAKAGPDLIGADEHQFQLIAAALESTLTELTERLAAARHSQARSGQAAFDRDQEIHRLTARLRTLRRFSLDLCLGQFVFADGRAPVYVGRLGLTGDSGQRLLLDWRSPAAEPFFAATHARPMGVLSRRRYRWVEGRIRDYWDEVFDAAAAVGRPALDDQSAFIASLSASRSDRMRDVLGTIQADQDAIIRAGSAGALVVDGGPGTGKTVVALHRTAYLLYSDPRLGHHRGGVLFVGPHQPYLDYVADVLPSLGEEGVQTATVRDLVAEGRLAPAEPDPAVARLKSSVQLVHGIETAVRFYEEPPSRTVPVATPWGELQLAAADWAEAFAVPDPGSAHNEARDLVWDELAAILFEQAADAGIDEREFGLALRQNRELVRAFNHAWPVLTATELVGDLWSVPAYLRFCAPWLDRDEIASLQRVNPQAWTESDLPLLDAARRRLGDPELARRRRQWEGEQAFARSEMAEVIDDLVAADDSELQVMSMLRVQDLQGALVDESRRPRVDDPLAGPFAHIVVDEAQELTDAQWQMLLARCPSGSFTIVGDRAQARHGFAESWAERLAQIGLDRSRLMSLQVNYRTPAEVMAVAEPVIRAALPDANVPTSIRTTGSPVRYGRLAELDGVLDAWLAEHPEGIGCVIGSADLDGRPRIRSLPPVLAKGLEFDLVVLLDPDGWGSGIEGAVDRYVAMTRATQQLVILRTG